MFHRIFIPTNCGSHFIYLKKIRFTEVLCIQDYCVHINMKKKITHLRFNPFKNLCQLGNNGAFCEAISACIIC